MATETSVQISGTFDIAATRQQIRKLAEELQWSPLLRVRATAALTALAEIAYFRNPERVRAEPLVVNIHILGPKGIEYHVDTNFTAICTRYAVARWHLERVCDHLVIENHGETDHIVMRVWANGGAS